MKNPFLRPDSSGGSFLPQDYVARKSELRANLICLGLFGVVMFCVVGAFFVTNRQWLQVQQSQKAITVQYGQEAAKIEQLKRLEAQKADMMEKAEITTALIEKVPRSTLMAELITRMPKDITLLEFHLVSKRAKEPVVLKTPAKGGGPAVKSLAPPKAVAGPKGGAPAKPAEPERIPPPKFEYTLKLVGVARVNNDIADYQTNLNNCTLLDKVELKFIKEHTIDKVDMRKFEIEAVIRAEADARGIEPVKDLRSATGAPGADPTKPRPGLVNPGQGTPGGQAPVATVTEEQPGGE